MIARCTDEVRERDHIGPNELAFFGYFAGLTRDELEGRYLGDIRRHAVTPSHLREIAREASEKRNLYLLRVLTDIAIEEAQSAMNGKFGPDVKRATQYKELA